MPLISGQIRIGWVQLPRMKPQHVLLPFLMLCASLRAVDKVPEYAITDTFATSPTMLLRALEGDAGRQSTGTGAVVGESVPLALRTASLLPPAGT